MSAKNSTQVIPNGTETRDLVRNVLLANNARHLLERIALIKQFGEEASTLPAQECIVEVKRADYEKELKERGYCFDKVKHSSYVFMSGYAKESNPYSLDDKREVILNFNAKTIHTTIAGYNYKETPIIEIVIEKTIEEATK